LLAFPRLKSLKNSSLAEGSEVQKHLDVSEESKSLTNFESSGETLQDASNEYVQLQRRIFKLTLVVSGLFVCFTAIIVGIHSSISLLVGALFGLIYLRLLSRSIGYLGISSLSVGKAQLLVPVVLVLVVTRSPQLELLPALIGFLLYKPSLIIQFLLEP